MKFDKKIIGFTSTIPVEIIFAANKIPLDLNNIFISSENPNEFINTSELEGFPRNFCAWTKGLYGVIKKYEDKIEKIIAVVEGDCSSNKTLFEVIKNVNLSKNFELLYFSYSYKKTLEELLKNIIDLMEIFNVTWQDIISVHKKLFNIRKKLFYLDEIAYKNLGIKNIDLHLWQISSSDFSSDYKIFEKNLDEFLGNSNFISGKNPEKILKLGLIGVPTIIPEFYNFLDSLGVKVIFNETAREFTFTKNFDFNYENQDEFIKKYLQQYLDYTYPYDIEFRIQNIKQEIEKRKLDGLVHYVQSFCHKQVDDISFRKKIDIPILTIEEDRPGFLSERTKIRLESFATVLQEKKLNNK